MGVHFRPSWLYIIDTTPVFINCCHQSAHFLSHDTHVLFSVLLQDEN